MKQLHLLVLIIIVFLLCTNFWILAKRTISDEEQYTNGNIKDQPSHQPPSANKDNGGTLASPQNVSLVDEDHIISPSPSSSCFRARKETIPKYMHGNLTLPIINLGE